MGTNASQQPGTPINLEKTSHSPNCWCMGGRTMCGCFFPPQEDNSQWASDPVHALPRKEDIHTHTLCPQLPHSGNAFVLLPRSLCNCEVSISIPHLSLQTLFRRHQMKPGLVQRQIRSSSALRSTNNPARHPPNHLSICPYLWMKLKNVKSFVLVKQNSF